MKSIYTCLFLAFFSIVQTYGQESEPLFDFITIADKYNLDVEEVQSAVERAQLSMQPYSKMIDIKVNNDHTIYHTTRQGVGLLYTKYGHFIEPPDTETLKQRIGIDQRDKDGSRLKQAIDELALLKQGAFDTAIDIRMINKNEQSTKLAQTIYDTYYK